MKITSVTLTNFRGYKGSHTINFDDLTVIVGNNDVGKSTILEALDLFFNNGKGSVGFEPEDINVFCGEAEYSITVTFSDLPEEVIIDSTNKTSLESEYLLNSNHELEVKRISNGSKWTKTYILCFAPTNPNCAELILKKNNELKRIVTSNNIDCDTQTTNAVMRKAIWDYYTDDLQLSNIEVDTSKGDDFKSLFENLTKLFPTYALFQSDRKNNDGDKEIQDPLQLAVTTILKDPEIVEALELIANRVETSLKEVSSRTLEHLRDIDSDIASTLNPYIPSTTSLKWSSVFKSVSLTADDAIPVHKRGSGVRRLILISFFKAEAERINQEGNSNGIIYAIEEPETSQHYENRLLLAKTLIDLSSKENTQVVITTHSGAMVKLFHFDNIRLVQKSDDNNLFVSRIDANALTYPSLNEVNFLAFGVISTEYFDELYSFIESEGHMQQYEDGKPSYNYRWINRNGVESSALHTKTHIIRDQIHHPENTLNVKYSQDELVDAINDMRVFIINLQGE